MSRDYLPSKRLLGCNHLWLRISREAWLGPCNSRSHEFSVKLSPRANITWRALTWLLAGVSCCWLWASDLCSLANDFFRMYWKFSSVWQSVFSRARDLRERGRAKKQKPSSFQPNLRGDVSALLHSVGDINSSLSGKRLQQGFHTRRLRSLETTLVAVYLSFLPPSRSCCCQCHPQPSRVKVHWLILRLQFIRLWRLLKVCFLVLWLQCSL